MSAPENPDCNSSRMSPGKMSWTELITSDPAGAMAYYAGLFGWETEPFGPSNGEYTMFKHEGVPFGGVMKAPREGVPTRWTNYVIVDDIEAAITRCTDLGGQVCMGPMDIPEVGRIAMVQDPQGAVIGLHQCTAK